MSTDPKPAKRFSAWRCMILTRSRSESMVSLVNSDAARDLDGHPAILRRYSLDTLAGVKRPYVLQGAAAEAVYVPPEKTLHPKVTMPMTPTMSRLASRLRSLEDEKEAQHKANADNSTTNVPANDLAGVSPEKKARVRSKVAADPLSHEGLITYRDRSTLWFERGALKKLREERQMVVRETRTGIIFHEFEGVGPGHSILTEVQEPAEGEKGVPPKPAEDVPSKPADAKSDFERIRNFRQDSAAGTAPVDLADQGYVDMTDLPTRRACFLVMMNFFNKNKRLIVNLLCLLH